MVMGEFTQEVDLLVVGGGPAEDLALTMHPHPSLSEATAEAAEAFLGSVTHILPPRRPSV
jgi:dihydrolipoamide dehydrogenase